jgi:hypothetical protein
MQVQTVETEEGQETFLGGTETIFISVSGVGHKDRADGRVVGFGTVTISNKKTGATQTEKVYTDKRDEEMEWLTFDETVMWRGTRLNGIGGITIEYKVL